MSLRRYSWRSMQQRPGRTILTVLSIVIGVTAAVGISLGTAVTRNAYKSMFEVVTGRAALEVDAAGGGTIPGDLLDKVGQVEGVAAVTPLIERAYSMSYGEEGKVRLQVLGIDPARDQTVRDYTIAEGRQVKAGENEVLLERGFAAYLGLRVGSEVRFRSIKSGTVKHFKVVGLLEAKSAAAATYLAMTAMPLDRAQEYLNNRRVPEGAIDKIQIVADDSADVEQLETRVSALLPETVKAHRPAASTQLMQEMLRSSEQGLRLATYFSLLMAAIIILNTFLMNVSERRRHISIMRAIGAKRRQITLSLLGESVLLGVVGTVLGIALGVGMAFVATFVVGRVFQVQLPRLVEVMTIQPFLLGGIFGLSMAVLAAYVPARLAGRISPLEGMNRIAPGKSRSATWVFLVGGLALTAGSVVLIFASIYEFVPIEVAGYVAPLFLVGVVMLDSLILAPQAMLCAWLVRPLARIEANLALKQVLRNPARTALTIGVLFVAGSTGVGMANSIKDSVRDVHDWFDQAITADFIVRTMIPDMARGTAAAVPDGVGEEIAKLPHITYIESGTIVDANVKIGPDPDAEPMKAKVVARSFIEDPPTFDLIVGDRTTLSQRLRQGEVVLASVLAHKLGVGLGDTLPLETSDGIKQVKICGITNDYLVGGLSIHMHRDFAEKWLGVTAIDGYMIKVKPGHAAELKAPLEAICRKYDVLLLSHAELRNNVNTFVVGVQWSLWILVYMGYLVAAFGVVNTLTMNVLEQTRELGLLRIVAMTKRQVWRTILMQALIIAGVGLPPGVAMGVVVAYVMNLAMPGSSGRFIDFHVYPELLIVTLLGAFVIVLIAAFFPARRATRINVVEALHYE